MTTLQEAAMRKALELGKRYAKCLMMNQAPFDEALESLRTALAQHGEQQPVCAGCGIPEGDVHISTCQSGKWPLRVSNGDTAAPAPQPAQEQVGINGLTDAETSASMSVLGLSKPAQGNAELIARSTKVAAELDDFNSSLDRKATKCIRELLTALQSAQLVAQYDKTEMNAFVQVLYDQKMQEGKHGHYETMFHVVHKAIARVGIKEGK